MQVSMLTQQTDTIQYSVGGQLLLGSKFWSENMWLVPGVFAFIQSVTLSTQCRYCVLVHPQPLSQASLFRIHMSSAQ